MARDKMTMPMSTAGLVRYFEESEKAIKIKPEYVIGASVVLVVAELILKLAFAV